MKVKKFKLNLNQMDMAGFNDDYLDFTFVEQYGINFDDQLYENIDYQLAEKIGNRLSLSDSWLGMRDQIENVISNEEEVDVEIIYE